jgi:hypothetical protein
VVHQQRGLSAGAPEGTGDGSRVSKRAAINQFHIAAITAHFREAF